MGAIKYEPGAMWCRGAGCHEEEEEECCGVLWSVGECCGVLLSVVECVVACDG